MSRPTHLLRHEHRVIEQGLRALDGICLRLKAGDRISADVLKQLLDFIQNYADRVHHAKEEECLFPALRDNGIQDEAGPLEFLRKEHSIERELLVSLELTVEEYEEGDPEAATNFVEVAQRFRRHLTSHMRQEDSLLFRLAEEVLPESVRASLIHDFLDWDLKAGVEIQKHYEQVAEELEKNWTI